MEEILELLARIGPARLVLADYRQHAIILPIYLMALLVAAVILLIQDLDRPNTGFVKTIQQPVIDVANSIATYSD